jgi:type IV pilus assembly protein PilA
MLRIKNRFKTFKAFSLLELMVVVAIVGILAAVASPAYKDYITRTKLTGGLIILEDLKRLSTEYYSINGVFPALAELNKVNTDFATDTLNWGDMGPSGWTGGDNASPYVEVQFASDTVPGQTAPRLAYVATVNGSSVNWECYTYNVGNIDSSISAKFLPQNCTVHP